jgi:hypothetical protein
MYIHTEGEQGVGYGADFRLTGSFLLRVRFQSEERKKEGGREGGRERKENG